MLIFESETYTMLTVFSDTEAGIAGKIALTEGRETQMQMAIGQRPVTFSLKTNTTYTLQTEETDVHFAYLHGGENLLEKGVRFLQSSNHKYDLHTVPPQGGVFGPAAMFRYNGMYHMFYIWNPFGENLKTLYWGHAAGKRKTALRPMPIVAMPPEELQLSRYRYGGAIGGTVEACGDTVKLLYTQCILDKEMHPISFGQMESQSRDILYFSEQEPTLNTLRGCCPKINGNFLTTCESFHGKGAVYAYTKEGGNWVKQGTLLKDVHNPYLYCAEFISVGRTHAVLTEGKDRISRWSVGTFSGGKFRKRDEGILDVGSFHMPCTVSDEEGQIMFGGIGNKGISLPRQLYTKQGRLLTKPAKEVYTYFSEKGKGTACYVCLTGSKETDFSVSIGSLRLIKEGEQLQAETGTERQEFRITAEKAEIFIDCDIAEVFINDGELVCSFQVQSEGKRDLREMRGAWQSKVYYFSE